MTRAITRTAVWVLAVLSISWLAAGCSGSAVSLPKTESVTGIVTYKGQPVEGAEVVFNPTATSGKPARGLTDKQGLYVLKTYVDASHDIDGVLADTYKVTVTKRSGVVMNVDLTSEQYQEMMKKGEKATEEEKDLLPAKYSKADESGLVASVKTGEKNKFDFALSD